MEEYTKEQFEKDKADIIARLGKPERDFDFKNESARQIDELITRRRQGGVKKQKETLAEAVTQLPAAELKKAFSNPLPPTFVDEADLDGFSEVEKAIIKLKFQDDSLNNADIARRVGLATQTVTALLRSRRFDELDIKYFRFTMPKDVRRAVKYLVNDNHPKIVEHLAIDMGIMKPEKTDLNITAKPIDDPEAIKMLREMSRKLKETEENK